MIRDATKANFIRRAGKGTKVRKPLNGLIELTYHCNLNCVHCYCKGLEDKAGELSTSEWKGIIDQLHKEGCLCLTFSGGDPLAREDFLEIYTYTKRKGFVIEIFTNGQLFTNEIINCFLKSPPASIEVTLNGITKNTYESIVRIPDSFERVMSAIDKLAKNNLPLALKCNCLKQNREEIAKIKGFSKKIFGKNKKRFKFDPMIYPAINGNLSPCNYRLTPEELLEVRKSDLEILEEYERGFQADFPDLSRSRDFLYRCTAWMEQFFINPYGRLKFCQFTESFSIDLRNTLFKEGFYNMFPKLLDKKFQTASKCKECSLRSVCYNCPARALLETGDEEAPVDYYCKLAKETATKMQAYQTHNTEGQNEKSALS
ncbi:radical SAM protein [Candidatus Omnitrophota bacterium]